MSVLLVNQFYRPDVAATGQHLSDLAEHLATLGYEVTVFAARGRYARGTATVDGVKGARDIKVIRFRGTTFGRGTVVGRLVDYLAFYLQVTARVLFGPRRDGIIFLTTPPLLPAIGWLASCVRGQRYGIWSMDLHPAAEIAAGMLRPTSAGARALDRLWRLAHRRADFIIALGPFMKRRIEASGVAAHAIAIVPPWSPRIGGLGERRGQGLRRELGLATKFVIMYSGNAGVVHEFDTVLATMRRLKDDTGVHFLFVGDGPRRREIESFASRERLPNFTYLDYFERDELSESLASADAHLITLRTEFAGISVPSKLYGIMAAGRPALFVGPAESEPAQTIREAACGAVIDSSARDSAVRLCSVINEWRASPMLAGRLGENGRRAFERDYAPEIGCSRIEALVRRHWGRGPSAPPAA